MLYVAVDERVSEDPVQQGVPGQVQDAVGHLVDPFGSLGGREHGEADVLEDVDVDVWNREHGSADQHAEQSAEWRTERRHMDEQPVLRIQTKGYHGNGPDDGRRRLSSEVSKRHHGRDDGDGQGRHEQVDHPGQEGDLPGAGVSEADDVSVGVMQFNVGVDADPGREGPAYLDEEHGPDLGPDPGLAQRPMTRQMSPFNGYDAVGHAHQQDAQ